MSEDVSEAAFAFLGSARICSADGPSSHAEPLNNAGEVLPSAEDDKSSLGVSPCRIAEELVDGLFKPS